MQIHSQGEMMLKYQIEDIEQVDENLRDYYEQTDDGYKLKVEDLPQKQSDKDEAGLRKKVDELLAEKKREAERRRALEEEAEKRQHQEQQQKGEFESLYKSSEQKREELQRELDQLREGIQREKVISTARSKASEVTRDASRQEILTEYIARQLQFEGDEIQVLNESGKPTIDGVDDLVKGLIAKYPFLADGNQASGGNARGNTGAGGGKKWSDLSEQEKVSIYKQDPNEYRRLRDAEFGNN